MFSSFTDHPAFRGLSSTEPFLSSALQRIESQGYQNSDYCKPQIHNSFRIDDILGEDKDSVRCEPFGEVRQQVIARPTPLRPLGTFPPSLPSCPLYQNTAQCSYESLPHGQTTTMYDSCSSVYPLPLSRPDFSLLDGCSSYMTGPNHYFWSPFMIRPMQKRKGGQVRFSNEQTLDLEKKFEVQKYLSPQERKKMAKTLGLSERQVKTWFQNRRAKWRRLKQESPTRGLTETHDDPEVNKYVLQTLPEIENINSPNSDTCNSAEELYASMADDRTNFLSL